MKIVITVDCEPGEECTLISDITLNDMIILNPLLLEIKQNDGYFPTGGYLKYPDPDPEDLYSLYRDAFYILCKFLPEPLNGFRKILEINVFQNDPNTLYM